MKKNRFTHSVPGLSLGALLVGMPLTASADWTERVTIKGFISAVYQETNQDLAGYEGELTEGGITSEGTTAGTQFGLNINAQVNDRLSIISQFLSTRSEEGYATSLEWGFLNINLNDNFDLRAGRIKYPGGLVSEYANVAHVYPWIQPPREYYSEDTGASQAVHEAFSGISLLASTNMGDMTYSANLFAGEVVEHEVLRTGFGGVTLEANWDDKVIVQLASNSSTMRPSDDLPAPMVAAMDGRDHDIIQAGVKVDWNNIVVYSEWADVDMGDFVFGESETSYVTLGYRVGNFLPHITVSQLDKAPKAVGAPMPFMLPFKQTTTTLGLRWDFMPDVALKFEVSNIELDSLDDTVAGRGLFTDMPDDDSVARYGIALDAVF